MKKLLKDDNGFTLLEIIISVAVLALISGFILQMFIVAAGVNTKARNVDKAQNLSLSIVENFKASKNLDEFLDNDYFADADIENNNGNYVITKYYDKTWSEKSANSVGEQLGKNGTAFFVIVTISDDENNNNNVNEHYTSFGGNSSDNVKVENGRMKHINVSFTQVKSFDEKDGSESFIQSEMFFIEGDKFFTN